MAGRGVEQPAGGAGSGASGTGAAAPLRVPRAAAPGLVGGVEALGHEGAGHGHGGNDRDDPAAHKLDKQAAIEALAPLPHAHARDGAHGGWGGAAEQAGGRQAGRGGVRGQCQVRSTSHWQLAGKRGSAASPSVQQRRGRHSRHGQAVAGGHNDDRRHADLHAEACRAGAGCGSRSAPDLPAPGREHMAALPAGCTAASSGVRSQRVHQRLRRPHRASWSGGSS